MAALPLHRATWPIRPAADALFRQLEEHFGPVLVLVNNAGVTRRQPLAPDRGRGLGPCDRHEPFRRLPHHSPGAARPMLRARYGRVVNIASIVGPHANPGQANYAASKAG